MFRQKPTTRQVTTIPKVTIFWLVVGAATVNTKNSAAAAIQPSRKLFSGLLFTFSSFLTTFQISCKLTIIRVNWVWIIDQLRFPWLDNLFLRPSQTIKQDDQYEQDKQNDKRRPILSYVHGILLSTFD